MQTLIKKWEGIINLADAYAASFRNGTQHTTAQHLHRLTPKGLWGQRTGLFKMIVAVLTTCHTQYT